MCFRAFLYTKSLMLSTFTYPLSYTHILSENIKLGVLLLFAGPAQSWWKSGTRNRTRSRTMRRRRRRKKSRRQS